MPPICRLHAAAPTAPAVGNPHATCMPLPRLWTRYAPPCHLPLRWLWTRTRRGQPACPCASCGHSGPLVSLIAKAIWGTSHQWHRSKRQLRFASTCSSNNEKHISGISANQQIKTSHSPCRSSNSRHKWHRNISKPALPHLDAQFHKPSFRNTNPWPHNKSKPAIPHIAARFHNQPLDTPDHHHSTLNQILLM